MNASMLFVVIAFGIALCVAAVFLWFLLRERKPLTQASQANANAKVYRDQISISTKSTRVATSVTKNGSILEMS